MIYRVKKLPAHIRLSQYLRKKCKNKFLGVQYWGYTFYLAETPSFSKLFRGLEARRDGWRDSEDALMDVIGSLHMQIRDYVLAGIREDVSGDILRRIETLITKPLQDRIEQLAAEREQKLLLGNVEGKQDGK